MTTTANLHTHLIDPPEPGPVTEPTGPAPEEVKTTENINYPPQYSARCNKEDSKRITEFIEVLNITKPRKPATDGKVYPHNIVTAVIDLLNYTENDVFRTKPTKKKHL